MSLDALIEMGRLLRSPEAGPAAHRLARVEAERAARDGLADIEIAVNVLSETIADVSEETVTWHLIAEDARCALHAIAAAQVRLVSDPAYPRGDFDRLELCLRCLKSVVVRGSYVPRRNDHRGGRWPGPTGSGS